jgi:hypothetical protein
MDKETVIRTLFRYGERCILQCRSNPGRGGLKVLPLLFPEPGDAGKEIDKTGPAATGSAGKIGAGKEWFFFGCQDDVEWSAPLPGHLLADCHVDPVNIRAFLPVHLYSDEMLVEDFCNGLILKGFMRHDMAPVTGGIPDRDKDRLVLFSSAPEGLYAPRVP